MIGPRQLGFTVFSHSDFPSHLISPILLYCHSLHNVPVLGGGGMGRERSVYFFRTQEEPAYRRLSRFCPVYNHLIPF